MIGHECLERRPLHLTQNGRWGVAQEECTRIWMHPVARAPLPWVRSRVAEYSGPLSEFILVVSPNNESFGLLERLPEFGPLNFESRPLWPQ